MYLQPSDHTSCPGYLTQLTYSGSNIPSEQQSRIDSGANKSAVSITDEGGVPALQHGRCITRGMANRES